MIIMLLFLSLAASAQSPDDMEAIMSFLGAEDEEQVNEDEAERLAAYLRHPLDINRTSVSKQLASGLMSRYQIMSLADYRARHGDVLSMAELSLVDGFGAYFTDRLSPFISFGQDRLDVPAGRRRRLRTDISVRGGWKYNQNNEYGAGIRARLEGKSGMTVAIGATSPYGEFAPQNYRYTATVAYNFRRFPAKVIVGDFNARFGQGLLLWNGLSLSTLSSVQAFMKNPAGISVPSSFTGTYAHSGVAGDLSLGSVTIAGFIAVPEIRNLMPAVNVMWAGRSGQISLTHYALFTGIGPGCVGRVEQRSSIDSRWCLSGTDIFAELAFDWSSASAALMAGTILPLPDDCRLAAVVRYFPDSFQSPYGSVIGSSSSVSNEYGLSFSTEYKPVSLSGIFARSLLTVDAAHFPVARKNDRGGSMQLKGLFLCEMRPALWMSLKFRFSERFRTWGQALKSELRLDLEADAGRVDLAMRLNVLRCVSWGFLSYLEGRYESSFAKLYLRQGFFHIDDWDDRIYVYERDAPASFNVPAYYGRGLWTAFVASLKCSRQCRLYLRAAYTSYAFMHQDKKKPGKAELKLQTVISF